MAGNLVVTTAGGGTANSFAGFLVVTSGAADPDAAGAVYDPDSLVSVMPDGGVNTIVLMLTSDGTPAVNYWGCGHWAAARTVDTPVEVAQITDGTAWTPAAATWQRVKTNSLTLTRSGNFTWDSTVMATYVETIRFEAGRAVGSWRLTFNAAAAAANLTFSASTDGGYSGIWYLDADTFDRVGAYPEFPGQLTYVREVADTEYTSGFNSPLIAYGPDLVGLFSAWSALDDGSPTRNAGKWKWIAANEQIRAYVGTTVGALAVTDGMTLRGGWTRILADRGGLEPALARRQLRA